jgi:hypothetical protein
MLYAAAAVASAYLEAVGIAIREPRRRRPPAPLASRVST